MVSSAEGSLSSDRDSPEVGCSGTSPAASSSGAQRTSQQGRGTVYGVTSGRASLPTPATAPAPRTRSSHQVDAAEAAIPLLTAAGLEERAAAMFMPGASAPVASDMGCAVSAATGELAVLAWKLIDKWPKARIDELSHSFGNFDRVVALGWLIADALGLPLLEREQAFVLGGSAAYYGKKISGELAAEDRRVGRAKPLRRDALARAAADAKAALLRQLVPLTGLAEVGAAPRKRRRAERPPLDEAKAALTQAEHTLSELKAELRRAQTEQERFQGQSGEHNRRYDRALATWDRQAAQYAEGELPQWMYEDKLNEILAVYDDACEQEKADRAQHHDRCSSARAAVAAAMQTRNEAAAVVDQLEDEANDAARQEAAAAAEAMRAQLSARYKEIAQDNAELRAEADSSRRDVRYLRSCDEWQRDLIEELWEEIVFMRQACHTVMSKHAPWEQWSRLLSSERDRRMTPPQLALAYTPEWRDCSFPDEDDPFHDGPHLVLWDGERFVCKPEMLCVYRPLEFGEYQTWINGPRNAYAQPERTTSKCRRK